MNETKIEWCDSTWNPVTGCLHRCEYCYARRIVERFRRRGDLREAGTGFWLDKDSFEVSKGSGVYETKYALTTGEKPEPFKQYNGKITPYPFGFSPTFHKYRLDIPKKWSEPRTIFVCSMADLFGDWVPDEWIEQVFEACEKAPQHRYLFLTKNPQRYVKLYEADKLPLEKNMWYGASVTVPKQAEEVAYCFGKMPISPKMANTFLSVEPILTDITKYHAWESFCRGRYADWIIVGAETGNRKDKVVPHKEWIDNIVNDCNEYNIPVFMKDSLIPIVGEQNIRRDFPFSHP